MVGRIPRRDSITSDWILVRSPLRPSAVVQLVRLSILPVEFKIYGRLGVASC